MNLPGDMLEPQLWPIGMSHIPGAGYGPRMDCPTFLGLFLGAVKKQSGNASEATGHRLGKT